MKKLKYLTLAIAGSMLALTSMNLRAADDAAKKADKDDGFVGVVTNVDATAKKITVKNPKEDKEMTYTYSEDTNVVDEDGKDIEITTIKEGLRIRVHADDKSVANRIKVTDKQKGDKKKGDKKKDGKE